MGDINNQDTSPQEKKTISLKKRIAIVAIAIVAVIGLCFGGFFFYTSNPYEAKKATAKIQGQVADNYSISQEGDNILLKPRDDLFTGDGIIFYPGGKVEPEAYLPLCAKIADEGIEVIIVEVPFNLAIFDTDVADGIQGQHKEVKHWYMMGHSLGGACASMYIAEHVKDFQGIIFLAAYPSEDLSQTKLKALSIYGTNDEVLNKRNYKKKLSYMPSDFTEKVLDGANHCGFGDYGHQRGDGQASLSKENQWILTTRYIVDFIKE